MKKIKDSFHVLAFVGLFSLLESAALRADDLIQTADAGTGAGLVSPAGQPNSVPSEAAKSIPNTRELGEADYALLGRIVWQHLQSAADPNRPNLTEEEIRAIVDQMQRNRNEITFTLDNLHALMNSPALCGSAEKVAPTPGVDVDRAGKFLQRLFH